MTMKRNNSKPIGFSKRGKFIARQSYFKKQEKHRIDNLMVHLKQLEKEEKKIPKLVEGKKS